VCTMRSAQFQRGPRDPSGRQNAVFGPASPPAVRLTGRLMRRRREEHPERLIQRFAATVRRQLPEGSSSVSTTSRAASAGTIHRMYQTPHGQYTLSM
jgi:hypothetical protein